MRRKIRTGTSRRQFSAQLSSILKAIVYKFFAGMAKLVDALDLGSSGETHQSSNLCTSTTNKKDLIYGKF